MTVPPSGWSGRDSGRITSVSWHGASATFSPRVRPVTVRVSGCSNGSISRSTAGTPPA